MARFARIDSQIRANRLILANRFRVPGLNPFLANRASGGGGANIANRRFEAIRANRSHVMKIEVFLRISEKPRIRLGCPSWSTLKFSEAPRKLLLVDFGRKEYGYGTSWKGGSTALQEPTLTVLLVLPNCPNNWVFACMQFRELL